MLQRNLPLFLAAGWTVLSLILLLVACSAPFGRDTWLLVDNFLVFDLLLIATVIGWRTEKGQSWRAAWRLAFAGPLLWAVLAVGLSYIFGGMFAAFPPLHFDYEASGEKTVAAYLTSSEGAMLWIGRTLAQGVLLGLGAGGFLWLAAAIGQWWQRRRHPAA